MNKAVRATKEIIVTGGAIETPKLLMLSGVGPADELNKHKVNQTFCYLFVDAVNNKLLL